MPHVAFAWNDLLDQLLVHAASSRSWLRGCRLPMARAKLIWWRGSQ